MRGALFVYLGGERVCSAVYWVGLKVLQRLETAKASYWAVALASRFMGFTDHFSYPWICSEILYFPGRNVTILRQSPQPEVRDAFQSDFELPASWGDLPGHLSFQPSCFLEAQGDLKGHGDKVSPSSHSSDCPFFWSVPPLPKSSTSWVLRFFSLRWKSSIMVQKQAKGLVGWKRNCYCPVLSPRTVAFREWWACPWGLV